MKLPWLRIRLFGEEGEESFLPSQILERVNERLFVASLSLPLGLYIKEKRRDAGIRVLPGDE